MKKLAMITVILLVTVMAFSFSDELYRDLTRRPENVEKESFEIKGEVIQWTEWEGKDYTLYRVATKPYEFLEGYGGNIVLLLVSRFYENIPKFMEGDIIKVSSVKYIKPVSYESIFGQIITVPLFVAQFWSKGSYK